MKKSSLNLFLFTLFLAIFLSYNDEVYPQKVSVFYEVIMPELFKEESYPIKIGVLSFIKLGGDSLVESKLYEHLKDDTEITSRFAIYPIETLRILGESVRIENVNAYDSAALSKLNDILGIKYIMFGESKENEIVFSIKKTFNSSVIYSNTYIDSDSSTALKDISLLFKSGIRTSYVKRGSILVQLKPPDADFSINLEPHDPSGEVFLLPGNYYIGVYKQGYKKIKEQVQVEEGKDLFFTYTLEPAYGSLKVDVFPEDATVTMRSEFDSTFAMEWVGSNKIDRLMEGIYILDFRSVGYYSEDGRRFRIEEGKEYYKKINLVHKFHVIKDIKTNNPLVYNLKVFPDSTQYEIIYSISGDSSDSYDVSLFLLSGPKLEDKTKLLAVKGDIGDDIFAGAGKKIYWQVKANFPKGILVNEYALYLEVD